MWRTLKLLKVYSCKYLMNILCKYENKIGFMLPYFDHNFIEKKLPESKWAPVYNRE